MFLKYGCSKLRAIEEYDAEILFNMINDTDIESKVEIIGNIDTTKVGEYKLEYTVPFRSSTKKYSFRFTVHKDILPEVSLANEFRDTYNKGETLTIPEVVVTNAANGYTVEYFIVAPNGLTTILKDEKTITLDQSGTYVLRVFVKDTYNVISKSWKFKVEV